MITNLEVALVAGPDQDPDRTLARPHATRPEAIDRVEEMKIGHTRDQDGHTLPTLLMITVNITHLLPRCTLPVMIFAVMVLSDTTGIAIIILITTFTTEVC